ncbi:MAG TPA: regulatory protein RecX [Prolixibacteraceae bacterium]|nr:regulatory protein RecX [Prolixibacteraceae bacterium]HPS13262.1 regulatory protein RecX [Prolixibacteraceae bacterium]
MNPEKITVQQALSRAMEICSKSEKCISDIQQKLNDWGVEPADAQKIIKTLIAEKFIDEERYVRFYVRDKFRFNQWGRVKIAFMLRSKKIASGLIDIALQEITEEAYTELLTILLTDKSKKIRFVNDFDRKGKLTRFAQSKGFEFEVINEVLKSI